MLGGNSGEAALAGLEKEGRPLSAAPWVVAGKIRGHFVLLVESGVMGGL